LSLVTAKYGKYDTNKNGMNAQDRCPFHMSPKLINGKVWIHVGSVFGGGYQQLPENDPKYKEIFLWIDSQRFVELLDWDYKRRTPKELAGSILTSTGSGVLPHCERRVILKPDWIVFTAA
jgi:hypothetical protein